jgi:hypothetical protein
MMLGVMIVEIMLILAVRKLTKQLEDLNKKVETFFNDTMKRLKPFLNAIATAKPFLDVFNTILGLFKQRKKRQEDE